MLERTCFAILPWKQQQFFEDHIKPIVDSFKNNGLKYDIENNEHLGRFPDNIEKKIKQALVCIVDITGYNANVMYELGIAHSLNRKTIIISQDPPGTAPADVRHWHIFRYSQNNQNNLEQLKNHLTTHLSKIAKEELLRWMLVPPMLKKSELPFVIAASPISWRDRGKEGGHPILTTTKVEFIGIKKLLLEFGRLFQSNPEPDLLNPGDYQHQVIEEQEMHLYCLGSSKANRWTGRILKKFSKQWQPSIDFQASPKSTYLRDPILDIVLDGKQYTGEKDNLIKASHNHDIGLILRGPNPFHHKSMMTVLAGRRGCGTEAACLAISNQDILSQIDEQCDLGQFETPFYALVEMRTKGYADKCKPDLDSLKLLKCGTCKKRADLARQSDETEHWSQVKEFGNLSRGNKNRVKLPREGELSD